MRKMSLPDKTHHWCNDGTSIATQSHDCTNLLPNSSWFVWTIPDVLLPQQRAAVKIWFVVFCCSTTTTINIKCMEDYSSNAFLQAFLLWSWLSQESTPRRRKPVGQGMRNTKIQLPRYPTETLHRKPRPTRYMSGRWTQHEWSRWEKDSWNQSIHGKICL